MQSQYLASKLCHGILCVHLTSWGGIADTWARWAQAGRCSSYMWEVASSGGVQQCMGQACSWSASLAGSTPHRGGAAGPGRSAARPGWWEPAPVLTPAAAGSWRASRPPHAPSHSLSHCGLGREGRGAVQYCVNFFGPLQNLYDAKLMSCKHHRVAAKHVAITNKLCCNAVSIFIFLLCKLVVIVTWIALCLIRPLKINSRVIKIILLF